MTRGMIAERMTAKTLDEVSTCSEGSPAGIAGTCVPSKSRTDQEPRRIIGSRLRHGLRTTTTKRRFDGADNSLCNHGVQKSSCTITDDVMRRTSGEGDLKLRDATGQDGGMTNGEMMRSGGSGSEGIGDGEGLEWEWKIR